MRPASSSFLSWGSRLDGLGTVLTRCKKLTRVTMDISALYGTHRMPVAPFGPAASERIVPQDPDQQSLTLQDILPRSIRNLEVLDATWVNQHRHPMNAWRQSQRAHHLYDLGEAIRQAHPAGRLPNLKVVKCGEWLLGLETWRGKRNMRCIKLREWLPAIASLFDVTFVTPEM